jgi:serine/threonine protein kinase/Tfp pilus assembly protein PilF
MLQGRCSVCGASSAADSPTFDGDVLTRLSGSPAPADGSGDAMTGTFAGSEPGRFGGMLNVGQNFGTRYHIIRLLGTGGMGSVYQAWDQVLEVAVAVKVVRPSANAEGERARDVERRFKRELLLARQVTHKHVVRIHDLGEIDGVTYITMPYVQGSDLATILRADGRLPVDRVLVLAKEVASGLAAAHDAGIVHRDLKPANIMVDAEGHALIMDFGIARSTTGSEFAMTATGTIVGTVEYMAPEQARGEAVDARADIYSFGLILNDLLLGRRNTLGTTAVAELMARMQQAPPSVRSIDPAIPASVDAIVTRCLQPDPAARYQRLTDLVADLDALDQHGHPTLATSPLARSSIKGSSARIVPRWSLAAACVFLVLAAAAWVMRGRLSPTGSSSHATNGPEISLAILPFRNASGDPTLDSLGSSLGEVLRTEIGHSSRVRTVPSDRLHQVLQDLRIAPNATLAPTELARVADFTSARSVLWGQYTRFGNAIRIDATLQDLDRQQAVPLNAMAPNEGSLLIAITELAGAVRQSLARGSADVLNELNLTAGKPSTSSFEALRLYDEGLGLTREGKQQAALKSFEAATKADGNFALAFSGLAQTYATLGYDAEAGQFSRRAMSLAEALPPQEKYLISANHYRIVNDTPKAIESYENLAKASPNSATVQFDLGTLYEKSGAFDQARERFAKVVALDPKFVDGLRALGRVEIRRGNPQGSLDHLNTALTLAIQLENDEARADVLQAIGVAYKRLDRLDEALRRYEESLQIKRRLGQKRGMAASLGEIAQIQQVKGQMREAEQSYREALGLQREIGDQAGISTSLVNLAALINEDLGRPDDALPLLREALQVRRDVGNTNGEALVLNNIGSVYDGKGQYSEAQTYFERALELREKTKVPREIADTLHNLAETLSKEGRFDQALSRYLRALDLRRGAGDRRGAAIESYSIGTIFDYQGRYGAAVKSKEEALQAFRDLKQKDRGLGEILSGLGRSLALSGRMDEAGKRLDEAMTVAGELRNSGLTSQIMTFQADRLYFGGDPRGANRLAEHALQTASRASDRALALRTQVELTMTAAALQPSQALASKLGALAQEADTLGLKSLSVESALHRAETLLKLGDRAAARREAERALTQAETFGLRPLLATAHYLRAEVLRLAGSAEARADYASALRLLDEIKGEEGSQNVLARADLGPMREACERWSKAA